MNPVHLSVQQVPATHVLVPVHLTHRRDCQHASMIALLALSPTVVCGVHVAGQFAVSDLKAPTCAEASRVLNIKEEHCHQLFAGWRRELR